MNKNLKEVLVRHEYHGQVWFEYIKVEKLLVKNLSFDNDKYFHSSNAEKARRYYRQINGQGSSESHSL